MARLSREADSYRRAAGGRWNSFAIGFHNPPINPPAIIGACGEAIYENLCNLCNLWFLKLIINH